MRRRSLALLPLPLSLSLCLAAHAADERTFADDDWRLCPTDDAVPPFADAKTSKIVPSDRSQLPTDIEGNQVTGAAGTATAFSGNVALTRGDQFLGADDVLYDSQTDRYSASGNVRYQDAGMRMTAQRAEGDQSIDSHRIDQVRYQLIDRRGHGGASHVEMQGGQGLLYDSTYTTCAPGRTIWKLQAERIEIDNDAGFGVARNAKLRVGEVPVMYVPYFPFPTDARRKTGLLYPSLGMSSRNGFDWRQPIYLNLAPNYDDTLQPRFMSDRGLMLENQFRYLTPAGNGALTTTFLPDDDLVSRERDEETDEFRREGYDLDNRRRRDRSFLRFVGAHSLGPTWQARANLNWVSDPRYFEDFSSRLDTLTGYHIASDLGLYGHGRYWDAGLSASHWQLTDYTLKESSLPYDHLPRLYAHWAQPLRSWLSMGVDGEMVRFRHVHATAPPRADWSRILHANPGADLIARPGGDRLDLKPHLSLPLAGPGWFVTPTLAWRYTGYTLDRALAEQVASERAVLEARRNGLDPTDPAVIAPLARRHYDTAPSRSMPIASLDAGLYFDRDIRLSEKPYLQTLEPRIYYLYAPYREQDGLPRFDTAPLTFSWGQLFRDNRYSGADRQTDADQLTVALTSRFIRQDDGREKLTASFGQIRYFKDQRVGLYPGAPPLQRGRSAWVADASYEINDRWHVGGSLQWDAKASQSDLLSARLRYLIGETGILNLSYRYRRNLAFNPNIAEDPILNNPDLLEQIDFSFLYPVSPTWSLVGRYYYSLRDKQLLEAIGGVQWESCCIAARLVARNSLRSRSGETKTAVQFELELKGLSTIGQDTEGRLRRAILGYDRDDLHLVPPPQARSQFDTEGRDSPQDP